MAAGRWRQPGTHKQQTGQGGATQSVWTWKRMWLRGEHLGKALIPFLGNLQKCVALPEMMACALKHGEQPRGVRVLLCSCRAMVSSWAQRRGGIAHTHRVCNPWKPGQDSKEGRRDSKEGRRDSKPVWESRICRELCLEMGDEPAESL